MNRFDVIVLDIGISCCREKLRIADIEDTDREYKDYLFHVKGAIKGMVLGTAVSFLFTGIEIKDEDRAVYYIFQYVATAHTISNVFSMNKNSNGQMQKNAVQFYGTVFLMLGKSGICKVALKAHLFLQKQNADF